MSKPRTTNYSPLEDQHLVGLYLEISQDPIVGINQSKEIFWGRIAEKYNSEKPSSEMQDRNTRSIVCRMQTMLKACKKFNACLQQVEMRNPSGANEQIILDQANVIMKTLKGYEAGFKFQHVWDILKPFVQAEEMTAENLSETPLSPNPSLSSFSIDLNNENTSSAGGSSSKRPEGVKKSKMKRKQKEDDVGFVNMIKEENASLRKVLLSSVSAKDRKNELKAMEIETRNREIEAQNYREESMTLRLDLSTIDDPELREFLRLEKQKIMQKRKQEEAAKQHNNAFNMFGNYFPDIGGSGGGLSDY